MLKYLTFIGVTLALAVSAYYVQVLLRENRLLKDILSNEYPVYDVVKAEAPNS